jgi:hypothetical protein
MTDKAMMVKPARQPGNDECEVFAFSIVDLSVSLCDLIFFFFAVPGLELRALLWLGRHSTLELHL